MTVPHPTQSHPPHHHTHTHTDLVSKTEEVYHGKYHLFSGEMNWAA